MRYHLGLGSNLGDRRKNLEEALDMLSKSGFQIIKASSLYETEPVGMSGEAWFYNLVVKVATELTPFELLNRIRKIEQEMGRIEKNQLKPRVIDIDILLAENTVIQTKVLEIPHPRLALRKFVLVPLTEVDSEAIHPVLHMNMRDLLAKLQDNSRVNLLKIGKKAH